MNRQTSAWPVACVLIALTSAAACADAQPVNDSAAAPGEWGFRPLEGQPSPTNPPAFVWRPQKDAVAYELQCARDAAFKMFGPDGGGGGGLVGVGGLVG